MLVESECKPCYCSSSAKEAITSGGKILVSEHGGESKIVSLSSTKLQLEDISDTLYSRPSLVSEVSRLTMNEIKRFKLEDPVLHQSKRNNYSRCSSFTGNTTIVEMLQGKIGNQDVHPIPRWSDCDCKECCSWIDPSSKPTTLYVKSQYPTS
ncbi:2-hydroxymuconic semialdehyde hydrolase, partial [Trifolium medium]|nr:2-hydroxymuconic semialdehyde hydrolase [Trifolium medium]